MIEDISLKEAVLDLGLDKQVSRANRDIYKYGDGTALEQLVETFGIETIQVAINLNKSRKKKSARVYAKTFGMVENGECVFLTLTFSDAVLDSTSEETRRRYVARFLKRYFACYVANIDFGDKVKNPNSNEREHYHALGCLLDGVLVDYSKWHKYGAIKGERVPISRSHCKAVTNYVVKLSRHALKRTACKGRRIIYSRSTREMIHSDFDDGDVDISKL